MTKLAITPTPFSDVYVIDTSAFVDNRGIFARWFCIQEMDEIMHGEQIVNVNFSKTVKKGAIRGMHFQFPPHSEIKMVRCIHGKIHDVVVDLRKNSPTFLQHFSIDLSEDNMKLLFIPKGFAHGFQTMEDNSEIMYLVTEFYDPNHESGLNPLDPSLNINWPEKLTDISDKDRNRPLINLNFSGVDIN